MSLRTNYIILAARNLARKLGWTDYLKRALDGGGYETKFDQEFQQTIGVGDCVWDVGANIGYYTKQFVDRVGESGSVVAFEPSPNNFSQLKKNCEGLVNVYLHQCGLGEYNDSLLFEQGTDKLGATSRVVENSKEGIPVNIKTGESLILDGSVSKPNAIKIDVEGFEYEVLKGLGVRLSDPSLHTLGIEIHFGVLNERGMSNAPHLIEVLLKRSNFKISWPDLSHLVAKRS